MLQAVMEGRGDGRAALPAAQCKSEAFRSTRRRMQLHWNTALLATAKSRRGVLQKTPALPLALSPEYMYSSLLLRLLPSADSRLVGFAGARQTVPDELLACT